MSYRSLSCSTFCYCLIFVTCFLVSMALVGLPYVLFGYLCSPHNGTEFNKCTFSTQFSHPVPDTNVSLKLQSAICVNCFKPIPESRKRQAALLVSFSCCSGIKSLFPLTCTTNSNFSLVNNLISCHKKACDRDGIYEPSVYILFY